MSIFEYEKDDHGIVVITMNMQGSVNTMNPEYPQLMRESVEKLEAESQLTGVVFASAKQTFFAGADLKQLISVEKGDEEKFRQEVDAVKAVFRRLEKLPVPVVAAINGSALGGGYEICLSCNYRIAWNHRSVKVGLPEVTLGLLPGAGGVVKLTYLLGLEKAIPYLLEGKQVTPEKAVQAGFIHETVETLEELLPRAKAWILENQENEQASIQPWDQKGYKIPGGNANHPKIAQVLMVAPIMLFQKTRGLLPAPERTLHVAIEAIRLDFETAMRIETRNLAYLVTTPQAKNMINTFFFNLNQINSGLNRPKEIPPTTLKKVGILGAGMMGQGIAYVSAMAGIEVILKDISQEAAEKGKAYSETLLAKRVSQGRLTEEKKQAMLDLITATEKPEDLQGCDLIVEAVFENMKLKHQVTKELETHLAENGVWASNTSTLPIQLLADASSRPENFIGLHFFSPVDKMPLLEIISGEKTSDETLAKALDYAKQIKKTPIVVNDNLGFYTSRTIGTYIRESLKMLTEGVHPVRVDSLAKAIGMPVGPVTISDEIGLLLFQDIVKSQLEMGLRTPEEVATDDPEALELMKTMTDTYQRIGKKEGAGFYDYQESGKTIWPRFLELYYKPDNPISDQDIKDRMLFRPVIESLRCLEENVLRSVADGNIGSIMGIGAPIWTGGYLQFVNTYGVKEFVERCQILSEKYGDQFRPPAIALEKAKTGEWFQ